MTEHERAYWIADKIHALGDYAKEAALVLQQQADKIVALEKANEAVTTDARCFQFWVSEAARNPSSMARLIANCTTEQQYRDAIMPCVTMAESLIRNMRKLP